MVKFLIIRFSSIGDIVLTSPVIRCLKSQVPDSQIHFLTKKQFACIVQSNPFVDHVHELNGNLNGLIQELKNEEFHYIIDLHRNLRTFIVKQRLRVISFTFSKLNFKKWLLVNFKMDLLPEQHIVDRYLEALHVFDITNDKQGLDFFIPADDQISLSTLPVEFQKEYIALAIGAKHDTKKMPVEKIISICDRIDIPVILLGGNEDFNIGEVIRVSSRGKVLNRCGMYNLNQSASILAQSKYVIAHDSGLMHIAAALKKDVISVWGNTVPEFGMYPYMPGKKSKIFQVENLACRPCSKLGKEQCPKKHFKCMNDIHEEELVRYIQSS